MLRKRIKYQNYNEQDAEATCYFHLSIDEAVDMELRQNGKLSDLITKLQDEEDVAGLVELIKDFIHLSYGIKTTDGERFEKVDLATGIPHWKVFKETACYEQLYTELSTDAEAAGDFVNGVMPEKMLKQVIARAEAEELKAKAEAAAAKATGIDPTPANPLDAISTTATPAPPAPADEQAPWSLPPSLG